MTLTRISILRITLLALLAATIGYAFMAAPRIGNVQNVFAAGDCRLRMSVYDTPNSQSGWIFCYTGVNTGDTDMSSENPSQIMGPLHDDEYHNDWANASSNESGIGRTKTYEWPAPAPIHRKACFYDLKNWQASGFIHSALTADGSNTYYAEPTGTIESFYWTTPGVLCSGET